MNVNAMEAWVDATVTIDGQKVGTLQYLMLHDTAAEKVVQKNGDSPVFSSVALNVPFDPKRTRPGVHKIRIEKPGQPPVEGEFTWPDPRGSKVQFLSVVGHSLQNDPSPDGTGAREGQDRHRHAGPKHVTTNGCGPKEAASACGQLNLKLGQAQLGQSFILNLQAYA